MLLNLCTPRSTEFKQFGSEVILMVNSHLLLDGYINIVPLIYLKLLTKSSPS